MAFTIGFTSALLLHKIHIKFMPREVLAAKKKSLVKQGRGNKPNACRDLTDEEEAKIYEAEEFGCSPQALQRTLWWFLSMHFGFGARDKSRKLCWGNIMLEKDPETGLEVLVWRAERGSKTRQGLEGRHRRQHNPRIYATGTERCAILFYKLFRNHLPNKACSVEFPFFLAVNYQSWHENSVWYKCSPVSKKTTTNIGKLISKATDTVGLLKSGKKVSNHSVRKTSISRLLDAGVPEVKRGLTSSKSASRKQQPQMSDTLSRAPKALPLSHSMSTNVRQKISSITSQSYLFILSSLIQETERNTFFAGATIGCISNCVFKVFQPGSQ